MLMIERHLHHYEDGVCTGPYATPEPCGATQVYKPPVNTNKIIVPPYSDTELLDIIEAQDSRLVLDLSFGTQPGETKSRRLWAASGSSLQCYGFDTARLALYEWVDGLNKLGYRRK